MIKESEYLRKATQFRSWFPRLLISLCFWGSSVIRRWRKWWTYWSRSPTLNNYWGIGSVAFAKSVATSSAKSEVIVFCLGCCCQECRHSFCGLMIGVLDQIFREKRRMYRRQLKKLPRGMIWVLLRYFAFAAGISNLAFLLFNPLLIVMNTVEVEC